MVLRLVGGHGLPPTTAGDADGAPDDHADGAPDDHVAGAHIEDDVAELTLRARGGEQGGATLRFKRGATVMSPPGRVFFLFKVNC